MFKYKVCSNIKYVQNSAIVFALDVISVKGGSLKETYTAMSLQTSEQKSACHTEVIAHGHQYCPTWLSFATVFFFQPNATRT